MFVVDSVDIERIKEVKTELHNNTRISENEEVPVLAVAKKKKKPGLKLPFFLFLSKI